MNDRELVYRFGLVGLIVSGVWIAAAMTGQREFIWPLAALAWWLSMILVIRPYVYERYGDRTGDWIIVILVLGPFAIFAAPILYWQHGRQDLGD